MDPIFGHKKEFFYLFVLFAVAPLFTIPRKKNSSNLAAQIKRDNTFAPVGTDSSKVPSAWRI